MRAFLLSLLMTASLFGQELTIIGKSYHVVESPFVVQAPEGHAFYAWYGSKEIDIRRQLNKCAVNGPAGNWYVECEALTVDFVNDRTETKTYRIEFQIGESSGGPPNPPDPPPNPPSEVEDVSYQGAKSLSDIPTATRMSNDLKQWLQTANASTPINTLRGQVGDVVENVLLMREGESQRKDWLNKWRLPVDAAINVTTSGQYIAAIRAVQRGLEKSLAGTSSLMRNVTLVMYSRADCVPCYQWKAQVEPAVEASGVKVVHRTTTGEAPVFVVALGGKRHSHTGYLRKSSLDKIISNLAQGM